MASIFLSYARDDAAKAKALAKSLERAGHSVWWDRHIHGGAEFSGEIEAALGRSDIVLVLWSSASVSSAWVRDEAAEGRDSGRLVPVLAEDCTPPLGFRQIQSISIAGWSGRGNPPHFADIMSAIASRAPSDIPPTEAREAPARSGIGRVPTLALATLGALLLAVGAWWLLEARGQASEAPVLAVLPFSDLSPQRDKAYFAEGVAEAILTLLAKEEGIRVVGRSTAQQLHSAGANSQRMRSALGITHVLEGSARSAGDQLRMSVRLIDASDGQQLWAEEYQRRLDNIFAVQDEIGRAVAQRLKGSFASGGTAPAQLTNADAYTLYLAARAKMRDRRRSSLDDAMRIARQVIASDPNYAPAHALYAELITHMSIDNYGTLAPSRVRELAEPHARRAIRLSPKSAEGYAALGMVASGRAAIDPLSTAIKLDPGRAELRLWLGQAFNDLGRQQEGFEHIVAATEIDPLWAPGATTHAYMLASSGKFAESEAVLAKFERRGGSPSVAAKVRADIAGNIRGDYSEAIRLLRLALARDRETPLAGMSLAWFHYMVGLPSEAARFSETLPRYSRLLVSDQQARLRSEVAGVGANIWQAPDPDVAVEALTSVRDWQTLERLHDAGPEALKASCSGNRIWIVQQGINFATALAARGRTADAGRYLRCLKAVLAAQGRGPMRSPFLSRSSMDFAWSQIHALEGRPREAFGLLARSVDGGARTPHALGLGAMPAFDRYRATPEYARIDARLKQLMARERAEILAARS